MFDLIEEEFGSILDMYSILVWLASHGAGVQLLISDHCNISSYEKETK